MFPQFPVEDRKGHIQILERKKRERERERERGSLINTPLQSDKEGILYKYTRDK
jgi:hypothetical protein